MSSLSASGFSDFFVESVNNVISNIPNSQLCPDFYLANAYKTLNLSKIDFVYFSVQDVHSAILSLSNSNCFDVYNINSFIIKSSSYCISEVLCHVLNICLDCGFFPDKLKVTKVIPVYKKGKKDVFNNYRPISLVPMLSKVFEKLISMQIINFLEQNKILSEKQFGFRKNRSTIDAVMSFVQNCLEGKEKKLFVGAKFYDLSKAFDTVDHNTLLLKLDVLGFSSLAVKLIKSYLNNRVQCVYFNNSFSDFKSVPNGVPQGSILGPLLFILYINDLPANINSDILSCCLYADDVCLTVTSKIDIDVDVSSLYSSDVLTDWCCSNKLSLNENKTQELNIFYDHCRKIEPVKFLGIVVQNDLKWQSHINYIIPKINKGIFMIRKLSSTVSTDVLLSIYYGYLHSHLSYGTLIWGNSSYANCLFVAQKKSVRLICKMPFRHPCKELFIKLGLMSLPSMYIYQCLLYVKRNFYSFKLNSDVHNYNTRKNQNIKQELYIYSKTANSFKNTSVKLFNKLPLSIRSLTYNEFKSVIKAILIKNCFYDLNEFIGFEF